MEITSRSSANFVRIFDILNYQYEKYPNKSALNSFADGNWKALSIDEVIKRSQAIAGWFIENGYTKGERILFIPITGSPEWMILDYACQLAGLIIVPMHPTLRAEEINLILKETESRLCIAANAQLMDQFRKVVASRESEISVFQLDEGNSYFKPLALAQISPDDFAKVKSVSDSISEDDVLTIMYTSGSSGIPKGVMLTHKNVVSGIKAMITVLPLEPTLRVISFLPFSHIFERVACYGYMAFGVSVYFNRTKESFAHDFETVRPHFCTAVPRVLEIMYDFMLDQSTQQSLVKRKLITWAMNVGRQFHPGLIKPWLAIRLFFARILVLSKWRKRLGGRIRYIVVGAASLRPEIGKLFSAAKIQVVEGYGMTETSPFISTNRFEPGLNRFGTVGLPIPGITIRIDEPDENGEGEIQVRGDNVMKGYFKQPEVTAAAFTEDGWFRTGDVGTLDGKGFLKITDRKKDIFKTSTGKYIAPQPLQNLFMQSLFIQRCLILGFQKPFVTALIVPNFESLEAWCKREAIHWTSPQFMVYNIKVREKIKAEVERLNEELPGYQRIRDFVLCHQDWSIEAGELTTTLKPVRHLLMEHYHKEIDALYR